MSGAKTVRRVKTPAAAWRGVISREIKQAERLFVLGIGNRRKGDDAAGCLCVRLLKKKVAGRKRRARAELSKSAPPLRAVRKGSPLKLKILDAGESPESATGLIREFRPTDVLIVDAAVGGHQPGTVFLVEKDEIRQDEVSTHCLPLHFLARYLEETIGCRTILVGIEPEEVSWGKPISPAVKAAAAHLAAWLWEILAARRT